MLHQLTSWLAATSLAGLLVMGSPLTAQSQMRPHGGVSLSEFDPAQLPEIKGRIAQFSLTPGGEIEGLILADGTEVQTPPFLSTQLAYSLKPGDAVTIRGLKARASAMVDAASVTNDASGVVIALPAMTAPGERPRSDFSGRIKLLLHTPRGEVAGAMLEDGTELRMPPPSAVKFQALLHPGAAIAGRGVINASPLGKVIGVTDLGASADKLAHLDLPRFGGMRAEMWRMHAGMEGGPGHGPDRGPDRGPGGWMHRPHDQDGAPPAPPPAPAP